MNEGEGPGKDPQPEHHDDNDDDSTGDLDVGPNLRSLKFTDEVQEILREAHEMERVRLELPPRASTSSLLYEVRMLLCRFLIFPADYYDDVVALWILHSHAMVRRRRHRA